MRISPLLPVLIVLLVLTPFALAAGSISIEKGMWETTVTITSPMFPQPRVTTETECVDKSEFGIEDFLPSEQSQCSVTESNVSGNTLTWSMQCSMEGMNSSGGGEITSKGDSGSGRMYMNMEMQGQSFDMETTWQGRRVGPC